MSEKFAFEQPIRFAHCDPSGIVYFPHYLAMINSTTEDWFEYGLHMPFEEFHLRRRFGVPVVNTKIDFLAPCRLGQRLVIELEVARMGRSSLELAISGKVGGEERLRARHRVAVMSLQTYRAVPIPDELRENLRRYMIEPPPPDAPVPVTHDGRAPANSFRRRSLVRFAHCDPAGIVFYPRFFDMFVETLEDWFHKGLEFPLERVVRDLDMGVPTVTITVEFLRACRMGEFLDFDFWLKKLGRSSIGIWLTGSVDGEQRLRAAWTVCLLDHDSFKSVPIPPELRARMERFVLPH